MRVGNLVELILQGTFQPCFRYLKSTDKFTDFFVSCESRCSTPTSDLASKRSNFILVMISQGIMKIVATTSIKHTPLVGQKIP